MNGSIVGDNDASAHVLLRHWARRLDENRADDRRKRELRPQQPKGALRQPTPERIYQVKRALEQGMTVEHVHDLAVAIGRNQPRRLREVGGRVEDDLQLEHFELVAFLERNDELRSCLERQSSARDRLEWMRRSGTTVPENVQLLMLAEQAEAIFVEGVLAHRLAAQGVRRARRPGREPGKAEPAAPHGEPAPRRHRRHPRRRRAAHGARSTGASRRHRPALRLPEAHRGDSEARR